MNLSVVYQPAVSASTSACRVRDNEGGELDWANAFLDGQRLRQLSPRSLRIYAYDLLDFARWFEPQHRPLAEITESTIVDYVRHQLEQDPKPTSQTVNHRLGTVRCCYRFHTGQEIPAGQVHFQRRYTRRSPLGYGRLRTTVARGLRLKQDRPVIVPLVSEALLLMLIACERLSVSVVLPVGVALKPRNGDSRNDDAMNATKPLTNTVRWSKARPSRSL